MSSLSNDADKLYTDVIQDNKKENTKIMEDLRNLCHSSCSKINLTNILLVLLIIILIVLLFKNPHNVNKNQL